MLKSVLIYAVFFFLPWVVSAARLQPLTTSDTAATVARIIIVGNETTKDYVIIREMVTREGEPLDTAAVERDQKRIYNLQLFNKVDISYYVTDGEATVIVAVSERWYLFPFPIIGFKYHDIKKAYYGAGLIHQNLRGRNEKAMISGAFGFDPWFNVSYRNPKLTDDDLFMQVHFNISHMRNLNTSQGEYDQRIMSGAGSFGKRFGLFTTVTGQVGYDEWTIGDTLPGRTLSSDGRDHYIVLSGGVVYDIRDVREYPLNGAFLSFAATKYGLGESNVNLFRYQLDLRRYQPLGDLVSVGVRGFGSFLGGGLSPSYLHAYYGYFERIRGYYSQVLEGEDQLGGSIECHLAVFKPQYLTVTLPWLPPEFSVWRYGVYAALFADAGTVWYRRDAFADVPWYTGFGAGIHFLLPYSFVLRTEHAWNQHGRGEFILGVHASF
jgi:outer membrane protein assembly factor BamA